MVRRVRVAVAYGMFKEGTGRRWRRLVLACVGCAGRQVVYAELVPDRTHWVRRDLHIFSPRFLSYVARPGQGSTSQPWSEEETDESDKKIGERDLATWRCLRWKMVYEMRRLSFEESSLYITLFFESIIVILHIIQ